MIKYIVAAMLLFPGFSYAANLSISTPDTISLLNTTVSPFSGTGTVDTSQNSSGSAVALNAMVTTVANQPFSWPTASFDMDFSLSIDGGDTVIKTVSVNITAYNNIGSAGASGATGSVSLTSPVTFEFNEGNITLTSLSGTTNLLGNGVGSTASSNISISYSFAETPTKTEELIVATAESRNLALIGVQPKLSRFLLGGQSASLNASVTRDLGNFDFATSFDHPVWAVGQGRWSENGALKSSYGHLAFGAHWGLSENILLGFSAQIDHLVADEGNARIQGTGWLVGPYAVIRMAEQPIVFSASFQMGQSDNKASPFGTFEDSYKSDRQLVTVGVAGEVVLPRITLIPLLDFAQAIDESEAYTNGAGTSVASRKVTTTEATFGMNFILPIETAKGEFDLVGGISATASRTNTSAIVKNLDRGQAELGFRYALDNAGRLTGTVSYDGIGQNQYHSVSAVLGYELTF